MINYSITQFGVANYKAISMFTEIEFNPITLLVGENNSGKTSFLNALSSFVDNKAPGRYIDIQPFFFDDNDNFIDFKNVKNKYSEENSNIIFNFIVAILTEDNIPPEYENAYSDRYDFFIKFGNDSGRIRLKETIINHYFGYDDVLELLHFKREEKQSYLKINISYIIDIINHDYSEFYKDIYESEADKLIGDFKKNEIADEIIRLGNEPFIEKRHFENGVYFPKTLIGVIRNYKYHLLDFFFKKFWEDVNSTQYKVAKKLLNEIERYIKSKLSLITDTIDVAYIKCNKIKFSKKYFPLKYYNSDIFSKKLIEYIEDKKYDTESYNLLKQLVKKYNIADDIDIEGDFSVGYSVYIILDGDKINFADTDISLRQIIAVLLFILMSGKFIMYFKGEENLKSCRPDYKPILMVNPEYNLNEEHQYIFADIAVELAGKLNTQLVIETDSEIMVERFIEADYRKIYYFSRNESNPLDSPILSDTEEED